ncbi:MAG: hypothetical protein FJ087_00080 [Deltaproteobacteria bacterium]|nr:hypothetical protein [Deltaproteobacteria bacterium]
MSGSNPWFRNRALAILAGAVAVVTAPREVSAIPAFARKYRTSCATCHVAFPKLNAFGEAYRIAGYHVPGGDEQFVKDEPVEMGSEAWKRVWPKGIWPSSIPWIPPVAVRATGGFVSDLTGLGESSNPDGKHSFVFPAALNLYAAGTLAEDVSLWSGVHLFRNGEWGELGKLHLSFSNLLDRWVPRQLFNLRIGLFVPGSVAFDHHRNVTFGTPIFATANAIDGVPGGIGHAHGSGGAAGGHGAHGGGAAAGAVSYSGAFALGSAQVGAELYGLILPRWEYLVGAVNGNGAAIDDNNAKDVYGRMRVKIGGMAFDGTDPDAGEAPAEAEPRLRDTQGWVDDSVILGASGYWGRHRTSSTTTTEHKLLDSLGNLVVRADGKAATVTEEATTSWSTDVIRAGGDIQATWRDFELLGMAVWGRDSNPRGDGEPVSSLVTMGQLDWVTPWHFLISTVRYESALFFGHAGHAPDDRHQLVAGLTALVRANIRIQIEGQVDLVRDPAREVRDHVALVIDAGF